MKKFNSEIVFIIDASGSMYGMEDDVVGGVNSILSKQKKEEGDALVSIVTFNSDVKTVIDRQSLSQVALLKKSDYQAAGCTALLDAVGENIEKTANIYKYLPEDAIPEKTIFVITTDGLENASKSYDKNKVKKLIEEKQEQGWQFLFLAANIDAVETARDVGISVKRAVNYHNDYAGASAMFNSVNSFITASRENEQESEDWRAEVDMDYQKRK